MSVRTAKLDFLIVEIKAVCFELCGPETYTLAYFVNDFAAFFKFCLNGIKIRIVDIPSFDI